MRCLFIAISLVAGLTPCCALACGGPAGDAIALSTDGNRYTVTNMGKIPVAITFASYGQTYSLTLAPGQVGTPTGGWLFNLPMKAYQTCTAIPLQNSPPSR